jgi:multidrug efflux pump subunit AcrA (membrane-fusion protein)
MNLYSRLKIAVRKLRLSIKRSLPRLYKRRKIITARSYSFIQRHPFASLSIVLGIFLLLMIVGNVLLSPKKSTQEVTNAPKKVQVFSVGKAAEISYQGKIEKSGVVKILAQAPGVVESINVSEGQEIGQGANILSMASNYSGGNTLSVARQLAAVTYQNTKDTYNSQKDIISQQRQLADKNKDNAASMRDIVNSSAASTSNLISLQQDIVNQLQTNVDNATPADKFAAQTALAPAKSALIQMQSSYNSLQLQANSTSADIANLNHDIAIKQLDLQEKSLQTALNTAGLQLRMAAINEASMFPASPFSGTVNKIFVHEGDSVNPGTPLAQISADSQHGEVAVYVPANIAQNISRYEASTLFFPNKTVRMTPTVVSLDATNGTLYSVVYDLGDADINRLTDSAYIPVQIPIGVPQASNIDPYIPLDSVFQTQEEAFVYVVDDQSRAKSYKVKLGQIQGQYVEALSGVPQNAKVILNRNVIEGDKVEVTR